MITLTQSAADKLKEQIKARGKGIGVQVGVKMSGCSGMLYVLEFVDEHNQWLDENKAYGISLYYESKDVLWLNGLTIDYVKKGLSEGFEFINPNEKGRCGTSFTI